MQALERGSIDVADHRTGISTQQRSAKSWMHGVWAKRQAHEALGGLHLFRRQALTHFAELINFE